MQIALYEHGKGGLFLLDNHGIVWPDMEHAPAGRAEEDMRTLATGKLRYTDWKRFSQMEPMSWQKWQTKNDKPGTLIAIYDGGGITMVTGHCGAVAKQYLGI